MPLVLLFHGYGSDAAEIGRYIRLDTLVDAKRFLLVRPDGTRDRSGRRFWNATDACCDFDGAGTDDVAYVARILDEVGASHPVDPKRVFLIGHSNGGFFAQRLACDLAPRVAAVVSLSGAAWKDPARCAPREPVNVLHVHGTKDTVIRVVGGKVFDLDVPAYPSLADTLAFWSKKNGCTGALVAAGQHLDLDVGLPDAETRVERYAGCPAGGAVDLWRIEGGGHSPWLESDFTVAVYGWLAAHPKP
jgi:polyhydroxybutyrate depolymerase